MTIFVYINQCINRHLFLGCVVLYGFNVAVLWPGVLQPDSLTALSLAQAGTFTGHVPVAYIKLWSLLWPQIMAQIPMFLIQVGLLWVGIYYLVGSLRQPITRIFALLLPFYPVYLHVNAIILREPHYIYAIFTAIALMIHAHVHDRRLHRGRLAAVLFLFFYAAAMKYQVRFIIPLLIGGALMQSTLLKSRLLIMATSLVVGVAAGMGFSYLDSQGVARIQPTHSWQWVKIYDLAAISYYANIRAVPEFLNSRPGVVLQDIKDAYTDQWETLVTFPQAPLRGTRSEAERVELQDRWCKALIAHPFAYMQHRLYGVYRMFVGSNVAADDPRPWIEKPFNDQVKALAPRVFSYITQAPFLLLYFFWGVRLRRAEKLASSLVFISMIVMGYIVTIMFNTLAFVPRYVYICNVLTFMCHPVALEIYLQRTRGKLLTEDGKYLTADL
ncbi:MAG: hypothetical protein H6849_02800 [Alphaproteobacteria bacterium]|nr:MAG: hypothetical protein H6849_02800 [Alphaproteobacteria bacterium]